MKHIVSKHYRITRQKVATCSFTKVKVKIGLGIEAISPDYMADALTTELLTMPAGMSPGTITDGS